MCSSTFFLSRMLLVFLLFCLSRASGGSCLSYGHSCWGGHGKRNGGGLINDPPSQKHTRAWYISKLLDLNTADSKNMEEILKNENTDPEEEDGFDPTGFQFNTDIIKNNNVRKDNSEIIKHNKWDSDTENTEPEIMLLTPEVQKVPVSKFHFYEIMNQDNKRRNNY